VCKEKRQTTRQADGKRLKTEIKKETQTEKSEIDTVIETVQGGRER